MPLKFLAARRQFSRPMKTFEEILHLTRIKFFFFFGSRCVFKNIKIIKSSISNFEKTELVQRIFSRGSNAENELNKKFSIYPSLCSLRIFRSTFLTVISFARSMMNPAIVNSLSLSIIMKRNESNNNRCWPRLDTINLDLMGRKIE